MKRGGSMLTVAIAQMYVTFHNVIDNYRNMGEMLESAKSKNANVIVFPSFCLSGNLHKEDILDPLLRDYSHKIALLSNDIDILWADGTSIYLATQGKLQVYFTSPTVLEIHGERVIVTTDILSNIEESDLVFHLACDPISEYPSWLCV